VTGTFPHIPSSTIGGSGNQRAQIRLSTLRELLLRAETDSTGSNLRLNFPALRVVAVFALSSCHSELVHE
jgi:hypothetical protein